jgi:sporulation protein YlmC with PRC-barrel domain
MTRTCDLEGKIVRDQSGENYGHVFEIQIKEGHLEALICGPGGFLQRLKSSHKGRRIAWHRVRHVGSEILIAND